MTAFELFMGFCIFIVICLAISWVLYLKRIRNARGWG